MIKIYNRQLQKKYIYIYISSLIKNFIKYDIRLLGIIFDKFSFYDNDLIKWLLFQNNYKISLSFPIFKKIKFK